MAYLPSNVYGEVSLHFIGSSVPRGAVCTFGVTKFEGLTQDDCDNISGRATVMHAGLSAAGCNLILTKLKVGPNDDGPAFETPSNEPGVSGNNAAPPNVALLIKKIGVIGGRHGRGRMFWPCIEEGTINPSGNMPTNDLNAKQGVINAFYNGLIADDLEPVILHQTAVPAPTLISNLVLDPFVATQRRRLRG